MLAAIAMIFPSGEYLARFACMLFGNGKRDFSLASFTSQKMIVPSGLVASAVSSTLPLLVLSRVFPSGENSA